MYYLGLISGTSRDGVDVALLDIEQRGNNLLYYAQYPYPPALYDALRQFDSRSSVLDLVRLHLRTAHVFADAVLQFIDQFHLSAETIQAIGSHGQTVLHLPDGERYSLQIGDPNIIAYRTAITTVGDFRNMDIAAGGEGAPLATLFHIAQFGAEAQRRIILNIGGVANITILSPADYHLPPTGFDTGPGNGLLDDWHCRHHQLAMDKDGVWAASGTVDSTLLARLLEDPYFALSPPKSLDRDYFSLCWLDRHLDQLTYLVRAEDVQATLLEFSACSIAQAIRRYAPDSDAVYVCGGGVHNPVMMARLEGLLPGQALYSTTQLGIDPDAVEAAAFAWLAYCRVNHLLVDIAPITGAKHHTLAGAVYPGERR